MTMAGPGIILRVVLIIAAQALSLSSWGTAEAMTGLSSRKQSLEALRVDLIRRDSPLSPLLDGRNLSPAQRVARAIERSHQRLRKLQSFIARNAGDLDRRSKSHYYSPVNAGEGEFLMQVAIGSPVPLTLNFIVDTGSDLTWTQCEPCSADSCIPQDYAMYNPLQSSSYREVPCSSKFCSAVNGKCHDRKHCNYYYSYGDLSYTSGNLSYETFSLPRLAGSRRWAHIKHFVFGCGDGQGGDFSNSTGIVGLGRGPLSFVSQIGSSINHTFSYCLGSIYNFSQTTPFYFGNVGLPSPGNGVGVTPLIRNPYGPTFYYLNVTGISVAGKPVPIPKGTFDILPDGSGGVIIDSGTTFTYLEDPAYIPFLAAVKSSIPSKPVNVTAGEGYDLCYKSSPDLQLPAITFHFAGDAAYELPANNSFLDLQLKRDDIVCLAFSSAGGAGSGAIFGNIQQQNFNLAYDLHHNKLYFSQKNCASM